MILMSSGKLTVAGRFLADCPVEVAGQAGETKFWDK